MEATQLRIDFETSRREAHSLFVLAIRNAIEAEGTDASSYHVLGFCRLVFNMVTQQSVANPSWKDYTIAELCVEFWLKRTAAQKMVDRALATGAIIRRPTDPSGIRCPYEYSIDLEGANRWLRSHAASQTSKVATQETLSVSRTSKSAKQTTKSATRTTYKEDSSSVSSFDSSSAPFESVGAMLSEEETERVYREVDRIAKVVRVANDRDKSQVLFAAVALVRGLLPQDAIEQALESVKLKRPDKPAAWFRSCLINRVKPLKYHQLEEATTLPPWHASRPVDQQRQVESCLSNNDGPSELEKRHGEQLDRMTHEERDELAATMNPMGQREFRKQRDAVKLDGLARSFILAAMEKRDPSRAVVPALK